MENDELIIRHNEQYRRSDGKNVQVWRDISLGGIKNPPIHVGQQPVNDGAGNIRIFEFEIVAEDLTDAFDGFDAARDAALARAKIESADAQRKQAAQIAIAKSLDGIRGQVPAGRK